ncbi:MAG: hypothetical protein QM638_08590 [Nocardioides sp.]|uniref:hypothetical protein n=1 Tax=Nocardioides sp. TaxID=35761 RepID=UPI0039E2CB6B
MESPNQPGENDVLAAWAPAGMGRIVVVLGQGVVIHKAIVSGKAGAAGVARGVGGALGGAIGGAIAGVVTGTATADELNRSPFIQKVLRNGVDGLLASPRKTLVRWDEIGSAEYRKLMLGRARMFLRTKDAEFTLKFLQNTHVAGDPRAVFAHCLGSRFTDNG